MTRHCRQTSFRSAFRFPGRLAFHLATAACAAALLAAGLAQPWRLLAQAPEPARGVRYAQVSPVEMKEWLTYLASDELQGRQIFTEGFGLAASYVADHLKQWGVKPLGDNGTYFQPVKLKGYKVVRHSSITVTVNGQSKTFTHGDHVTFAANSGGRQTLTFAGVEFVGYGAQSDYQGRDVRNKLVVWLPNRAPAPAGAPAGGRGGGGRGGAGTAAALSTLGARAAMGFAPAPAAPTAAEEALTRAQTALQQSVAALTQAQQQVQGRGGRGGPAQGRGAGAGPAGRGGAQTPDFTTVQRVDNLIPPQLTADATFYDFLFSAAPSTFADLNARAEKGDPLTPMTLSDVTATITIDNTFDLLSTQLSKNVVGLVEGSDPRLKDTYVMFGAHLDHIGYRQTGGARPGSGSCRRTQESAAAAAAGAAGQSGQSGQGRQGGAAGPGGAPAVAAPPLPPLDEQDTINNGADDDGSGSTALMSIAKAFATGPRPRRSVVFVWHTGEESGLYGSRYNADFPVVPLDKVQAQLNIDMIGRDDCDNLNGDYTNSVFIVGADRISTDLHNLIVDTNATNARPLALDYELNDVNDPENIYTRSDHYSYALKGIPIAFFTTGLHKDYHQVSDSVEKILFPKMARITQLVYETGFNAANTDRVLERDNKGPRTGKGFAGKLVSTQRAPARADVIDRATIAGRASAIDRGDGPARLTKPRIAPLAPSQWTSAQRALVGTYGRAGRASNELATLLNHPELTSSVMAVVKYFAGESTLSPRHREILILRTAWLCRSDYVWAHHAAAARQLKFTNADLRRIAQGPQAAGLDPFEATLLRAADELHRNSSVSNATWAALSARFDQHQIMDATFTVPAFTMLAMLDRSLGVQMDPGITERLPADIPYRLEVPAREAPLAVARIPPLEPADWTPAIRTMLDPAGSGRNIIAVYRTFARHPALYAPRQLLSEHIRLQNTLAARERELVILRMGWIGRSENEWQQHAPTGRTAGLDTARVAAGPDAPGWEAADRALLRAADEIYRDDMVSDATWAALTPHFDVRQMMDALVTAGGYRMVSTVLNAFGVQLEPGNERFPVVAAR